MSQRAQAPSPPVSLRFTPDGQRVVVSSDSGVRLIDVAGQHAAIRLGAHHATDLIAFDTEIWLVQGEPPELLRFNLAGSPLGQPTTLPPGPGRLVRSPFGEPVAVWMAEVPTLLASSESGVTQSTLPRADMVLPLSARRWLSVEGPRVTLREPGDELWTSPHVGDDMRAIDGAPLFDARAIALLCESHDHSEHQILVLSTRDGGLQHRIALTGTTLVRFAPRRGYAMVLSGLRKLTALDLRFGKVVKEFDETRDVVDVAIDDLAQHLAMRLRGDDGEIETVHTTYRDLLAAAPHEPAAGSDGGPTGTSTGTDAGTGNGTAGNGAAATSPATPTARTLPVIPRVDRKREPPPPRTPEPQPTGELQIPEQFLALNPRPLTQRCSRAESFMLLERYLALVGAWCERAIATAWDRGRLTYPNEGRLPFETEVAGILGRERNHAQPQLGAAQAHVVEAAAAVRDAELQVSGRLTPLGSLAREFGLSPLAYEILMIVAAPTLWGELSRLYGILANDPDRPLCDELLVCQILSGRAERHDIARELDRDRPLYRYGLVRPGDGRVRPFISLATDPLVIRQLRAESMDGDPGETISVRVADRTLREIRMPELTKRELLSALARAPENHVRIAVQGRIGSGRRTLLAALAAHANRNLGVIDASLLSRDPKARLESLRVALRRVVLRGWIPCVEGLDDVASDDQATREQLRELFRSHPGPLALRLSWDAQPPLDPGYLKVDLPPLKDHERIEVWRAVTERHGLMVKDVEDIALRYRVGAGVIEKVAAAVARAGDERRPPANDIRPPDGADRGRELDLALRQHLETRLGQTATRVTRLATWSDTVLPTDVLDSLFELIARIRHRRTVYDAWGFDRTMTTSRGLTALFQGGPGTGKSMVAGVIASELGLDLYRVDLSRIMSKWIGETERNLASVFDAAEDGQAIILFDEADSLFAKRTEVRSSVDRYANLEVNYLLQRLDTFEGIAILTTNFGGSIDSAFKRRLSLRLTFPFPDEEMREQLWRVHLPPEMPTAGEFDLSSLSRKFQLSGGYIRNATLRAAFLAAEEHSPLTQDHLERAIRLEYREMGKLGDTGVLE